MMCRVVLGLVALLVLAGGTPVWAQGLTADQVKALIAEQREFVKGMARGQQQGENWMVRWQVECSIMPGRGGSGGNSAADAQHFSTMRGQAANARFVAYSDQVRPGLRQALDQAFATFLSPISTPGFQGTDANQYLDTVIKPQKQEEMRRILDLLGQFQAILSQAAQQAQVPDRPATLTAAPGGTGSTPQQPVPPTIQPPVSNPGGLPNPANGPTIAGVTSENPGTVPGATPTNPGVPGTTVPAGVPGQPGLTPPPTNSGSPAGPGTTYDPYGKPYPPVAYPPYNGGPITIVIQVGPGNMQSLVQLVNLLLTTLMQQQGYGQYPGTVGQYPGTVGQYPGTVGQYPGPVGQYPGPVGQYPGPVGQYPGTVGQYPGTVGQYPGPVGQYPGGLPIPGQVVKPGQYQLPPRPAQLPGQYPGPVTGQYPGGLPIPGQVVKPGQSQLPPLPGQVPGGIAPYIPGKGPGGIVLPGSVQINVQVRSKPKQRKQKPSKLPRVGPLPPVGKPVPGVFGTGGLIDQTGRGMGYKPGTYPVNPFPGQLMLEYRSK